MSRIINNIKNVFGLQAKTKEMVKPADVVNAGSQVLKVMKPHTPMIKFRVGSGAQSLTGHVGATSSSPTPSQAAVKQKPAAAPSSGTLEDWELPSRYRRRPISDEEVSYINRGGPA